VNIIINGVGIAGPVLAYWLNRTGHTVLLVEEAPRLRAGGYLVDFWGIGYDIAEEMGMIDEIRRLGYQVREVRFLDRRGHQRGGFDVGVFRRMTNGRFTSVRRSDISATVYAAIEGRVETLFGDSVAGVQERAHGVRVAFDHAPPRDADLVIGADGLHSRVRELVFGPAAAFEYSLGYHVAAFEVAGYRPRDELAFVSYSLPGRQLSRFAMRGDTTLFLFVFRNDYLRDGDPISIVRSAFAGGTAGEWTAIEKELERARNVYFDSVTQIRMDRWTKGRIALVGDAAACVSLMAGEGTGLAIAEAYVLAGELHACAGDVVTAFARYEQRLMPFLKKKQESAASFASSFAPATWLGIGLRNAVTALLRWPFIADFFVGRQFRDDIELPDYGLTAR
jgi:2-polyprenyl-6-methoxyphenol hydroxylase-like FAD-dependent oxidoreductase